MSIGFASWLDLLTIPIANVNCVHGILVNFYLEDEIMSCMQYEGDQEISLVCVLGW